MIIEASTAVPVLPPTKCSPKTLLVLSLVQVVIGTRPVPCRAARPFIDTTPIYVSLFIRMRVIPAILAQGMWTHVFA